MLTYNMEKIKGETKTAYLYRCIKDDILCKRLAANEKLPSKRALALHLGVSLITVENAYAELQDEGYIYSKPRSGFFVNEMHPTPQIPDTKKKIRYLKDNDEIATDPDLPAPRLKKSVRRVLADNPAIMLQKAPHCGCSVLRNAISDYLLRYRGMMVQPEQVIIGSGAETLYAMDSSDSVIYMNSFSKSIAPGMRIAYMVLPERLLSEYDKKLGFYSCTVPVFDQYVLAEFINSNEFERHLRRIRKKLQK